MARRSKKREKPRKLPRIEMLYTAQNGMCYLCDKKVPHPKSDWVHHLDKASLDHVRPKNALDPNQSCQRIRKNALVAHHGCNNRKSNRQPYACEVLYLDFVNDKMVEMKAEMKVRSRSY